MKHLKRIATYGAAALAALFLILAACWWLIPDEPLNPDAERFVAQAVAPPAARNAYFLIWGFPASPELDPHAVGRQIVAAHDRLLAAEKGLAHFKPDQFYGEKPFVLPKDSTVICDPTKEGCLAAYQSRRARVEADSAASRVYLDRYRRIRDYEDFGAAMSQANIQSPMPAWQPILRMSDLVDASIALRAADRATRGAAVRELAAEVASWRRILQGNDWLLTQMVATASLYRKYRLASEIMAAYPEVVAAEPEAMAAITRPLLHGEANIAASMRAESRTTLNIYREFVTRGAFLDDSFFEGKAGLPLRVAFQLGGYRPNASINRAYATFREAHELYAGTPRQVLEGQAAFQKRLEAATGLSWSALFYNPVGRVANAVVFPDYSEYAHRIHDLIGQSRLIDLQRRILAAGAGVEHAARVVAEAGPALADPYTEGPMRWDAATARLSFTPRQKRYPNIGHVDLVYREAPRG